MAAASASAPADLSIPLIDISPLQSDSLPERQACGQALLDAFERYGFVYLSHHPIPEAQVASVFAQSAAFFARPSAQKESLAWTTPASNRGYVRQGLEKVSQGQTAEEVDADRAAGGEDLKETMEIGRDDEAGHPNRWPDAMDAAGAEFRTEMSAFFGACKALHRGVMAGLALGLGIDEAHFDPYVRAGDNTLRLLHYPPVSRAVFRAAPGQVRAGAHTDYGSITLLFQDDRGGLEVQVGDAEADGQSKPTGSGEAHGLSGSAGGAWLPVTPIPGTIVVNAGDLLALWSNGRIRSTRHRVVEPPAPPGAAADAQHPARYSVAYFCNPDFDKWIEAIPGTYDETGPRFEGCNSREYLERRLGATYAWQKEAPEAEAAAA